MKRLLLGLVLLGASMVNAQMEVSMFTLDAVLEDKMYSEHRAYWRIEGMETEFDDSDDMLVGYVVKEYGDLVEITRAKIRGFEDSEDLYLFKVQDKDGQKYSVVFWYIKNDVEPMVAYQYSDGYVTYTGNINY